MEEINYNELGLRAGLEIHQQLDTNKLFCNCQSILRKDAPLFKIKRKIDPVIGENGKIDIAAEYEKQKDKTFFYEVFDTNCLVELDEEPPHEINKEALRIALHIALLLNCKIFPFSQIMRKTVVNGSNTSGFQRTVLLAHDGFVKTSFGKVGIDYVFLEEDSARPSFHGEGELELENSKTYKLDRLGIPLVEIATGPHMHTPEQIKETALKIGEILRACKVKRGIGTIRQDVNVSIRGSERVEIKGFQDPSMMNITVIKEIQRQQGCIEEKSCQKEVRKANQDGSTIFIRPMSSSARMYPETDCQMLKISESMIDEAKATLPKLASENKSLLRKFGLNDELIRLILYENKLENFKYLTKIIENPQLIAKCLVTFPKDIALKEKLSLKKINNKLKIDVLESVLSEVGKTISEDDVRIVLQKLVSGESFKEAITKEKIDLEEEIKYLIKEKPGLNSNAYMGLIMGKFNGRINGKEVMDYLKRLI